MNDAPASPDGGAVRENAARIVISELDQMVYVIDSATYELLFLNECCEKTLKISGWRGKTCFQAIHGRRRPCPWCPQAELTREGFHRWEWTNRLSGRRFSAKSKLIDWDGRQARLEIADDVTDREKGRLELKRMLDTERLLVECVRTLSREPDMDTAIDRVLEQLGLFHMAERACLFEETELEGGAVRLSNRREWCAPGISPRWQEDAGAAAQDVEALFSQFGRSRETLRDIEILRESRPKAYAALAERGVHSLLCAPVVYDGAVTGVLGVENPARNREDASLLESLAFFIANEQQKRSTATLLREMSFADSLTGLSNRNGYMRRASELARRPPASLGVVFADLNGLKKINDERGHHAGDAFIKSIGQVLQHHFRREEIYRVGGDEFIILCRDIPEARFEAKIAAMRAECERVHPGGLALGSVWQDDAIEVPQMVQDADELMYEEKTRMHAGRDGS